MASGFRSDWGSYAARQVCSRRSSNSSLERDRRVSCNAENSEAIAVGSLSESRLSGEQARGPADHPSVRRLCESVTRVQFDAFGRGRLELKLHPRSLKLEDEGVQRQLGGVLLAAKSASRTAFR